MMSGHQQQMTGRNGLLEGAWKAPAAAPSPTGSAGRRRGGDLQGACPAAVPRGLRVWVAWAMRSSARLSRQRGLRVSTVCCTHAVSKRSRLHAEARWDFAPALAGGSGDMSAAGARMLRTRPGAMDAATWHPGRVLVSTRALEMETAVRSLDRAGFALASPWPRRLSLGVVSSHSRCSASTAWWTVSAVGAASEMQAPL